MSDELRVSDGERERASREIREHFAEGRIDQHELSERLDAVYRARTVGELRALSGDLPVLPATQRAELVAKRSELQRRLLHQTGGALVPFLICTVIWVAGGASGAFWPIWVALFALIPLVRNGWDLYGPAPQLERVEQELAARERSRGRHRRDRHRRGPRDR